MRISWSTCCKRYSDVLLDCRVHHRKNEGRNLECHKIANKSPNASPCDCVGSSFDLCFHKQTGDNFILHFEPSSILLLQFSFDMLHNGHCASCNEHIGVLDWTKPTQHAPYFNLISSPSDVPCKHDICVPCFGIMHAERGNNPNASCPVRGCNSTIVGHKCYSLQFSQTRKITKVTGMEERPPKMHSPPMYDKYKDPVRRFLSQSMEFQRAYSVFSVAFRKDDDDGRAGCLTVELPLGKPCDSYSKTTKKQLLQLLKVLHFAVLSPSHTKNDNISNIESLQNFDDLLEFAKKDRSFLTEAMVALGSGLSISEVLPHGDDSTTAKKSNFWCMWGAGELLRRASSKRPGVLQKLVSHVTNLYQVKKPVLSFLVLLRLATSTSTVRLCDINQVNNTITKGFDVADMHWSVLSMAYDNLGWKVLGKNVGYDQYTMIQWHEITVDMLKSIGFYRPPDSKKHPINRERKIWAEERKFFSREAVLPDKQDYMNLADQTYAHIDALMQLVDELPTLDEARDLVDKNFDADIRLTTSYGTRRRISSIQNEIGQIDVVETENPEQESDESIVMLDPCLKSNSAKLLKTMYEQENQHIHIDLPMKADLNKTETVQGLINSSLNLRSRALNGDGTKDINTNEIPLMEDLGIFMAGDGSPSYTFSRLKAKDPERFKDVQNFCGGFHTDLNFNICNGTRFADSHLRYFLKTHRDTEAKQDWYLFPGDPGQRLLEQPEMTAPHYVSAIHHVAKVKKGEEISPVDVDEHMVDRAMQHDLCMDVLLSLRMTEVANMIRDSEKEGPKGNADLFLCGLRLATLLFVRTHSTKYVRIAIEYWIWWKCTSEADRLLFREFFFTKQTVNGKPIWTDRCVEWMNLDIREYLGKFARPNQELLLQKTALLLKDRARGKATVRSFSNTARTDSKSGKGDQRSLALSSIFCNVLSLVEELNLWGDGSIKINGEVPESFTNPFGERLNCEILFDISSAEQTLSQYFHFYYLQPESPIVERSEKDVSLRMHPVKLADVSLARKNELLRITSTSKEELEKICTKPYLAERLSQLYNKFDFFKNKSLPPSNALKGCFAQEVADAHKLIINTVPGWKEDTQKELEEAFNDCGSFADPRRKVKELKHSFYTFPCDAKEIWAQRKYCFDSSRGEVATPARDHNSDNDHTTPLIKPMDATKLLFSPSP